MGGSELDPKSFQYKIILTVMKVMNLSNAEITSMHDYVSAVEQSESLRLSAEQKRNDAKRLIEEASSLDSQAQRVIQNAREKIASDCFIDK